VQRRFEASHRSRPPESPPLPFLQRAGSLLGAGAIAASLASVPAALRVASAASPLGAWLAIVACILVPAITAVAVVRGARDGWSAFEGADAGVDAAGVVAWTLATLIALAALGAGLRATTHHHGLAGVTFGITGAAVGAVIALFTRRAVSLTKRASPPARFIVLGGAFASLIIVVVTLAARLQAVAPFSPRASALLVDAMAFAIAVTLLSKRTFTRATWLARAGVPLSLGLFALGFAVLSRSPAVAAAIAEHAPAFAWLASLVSARLGG